ncbi:MAG: tetratricopeptide repeat protein [Hyphomicrobiales bacterium]|nr:tetratricopeptide repeat protein [Hyphomicrobiales bacterium]
MSARKPSRSSRIKPLVAPKEWIRVLISVPFLFWVLMIGGSREMYASPGTPVLSTHESVAGYYLSARFAAQENNPKEAARLFDRVLATYSDDTQLMEQGMRILLLADQLPKAENLAKRYTPLEEHATLADILLVIHAIKQFQFSEAEQRLTPLFKAEDKPLDEVNVVTVPLMLAWVQASQGKLEDGLAIIHAIDDDKMLPFLQYQAALMHDIAGNKEEAHKAYNTLLAEEGHPLRVTIAAARFFNRYGDTERAETLLESYAATHPAYIINTEDLLSRPVQSRAQRSVNAIAEVLLEIGGFLYTNGAVETPIAYFRLALALNPELDYARMLLAASLEKKNLFYEANQHYQAIPKDSPFYRRAQTALAININRGGDARTARRMLEALAETDPENPDVLLHLGDILLNAQAYDDAIHIYTEAIDRLKAPTPEHWAIYYARGIAYERNKEWKEAEDDFRKALSLYPEQPDVLNYLAYSWLLMNRNLNEARDMLDTALQNRPEDAHIIDSYGWALYKLGNYDEAVRYLELANLKMPYDPTTNDHLGDVYWHTGRKLEARYQWERALTFDPEPEDREKIKAKLNGDIPDRKMPVALNTTHQTAENTPY